DEAFRDELAELAQAALFHAVAEEQPAVCVAGDHVTGVQPSGADLLDRGLRVLEIGEPGLSALRPNDQLAGDTGGHGSVRLVDDVHLEQVLGRFAEGTNRPDAGGRVGESPLHRPVPLEDLDSQPYLEGPPNPLR